MTHKNIKDYFTITKINAKVFIVILILFSLFFYCKKEVLINNELDSTEYSFKKYNVDESNKWSTFKDYGNGSFFIHPGKINPVKGVFTLNKDLNVVFDFSLKKSGIKGEIEFLLIKNGDTLNKFLTTLKEPKKVSLFITEGDKIEIIADKFGSTSFDHGNLKITVFDSDKFIILPIIWVLFFILLFQYNYSYLFINSFIYFILIIASEVLGFGSLTVEGIFNYTILIFSISFLSIFIFQNLFWVKKYYAALVLNFVIALTLITIPICILIYVLNFDVKITKDILFAILQSNSNESLEYISDSINFRYILLFTIIGPIYFFLHRQEKVFKREMNNSILLILIGISFCTVLFQLPKQASFNFISKTYKTYYKEISLFKEAQKARKSGEINFNATKKGEGETYIIVIGESLSKNHMGLYDYLRNTTPKLSKMEDELVVFDNVYSNHTHTMSVLTMALTETNQYAKKGFNSSLSIIELLNKADIETYWLTNQLTFGPYDNLVSVISAEADNVISINSSVGKNTDTNRYDGDLIKEVAKTFKQKTDKNRVIFVHLMGNHASYKKRYPNDKFSVYKNGLNKGEFGANTSKNSSINYYDNSVQYNDYVVSSILNELKDSKSNVKGFVYMPDHGEDVIKNVGHNSTKFTYEMTQIPMVSWFSDGYKIKYKEKYQNLLNNSDKLFSNDLFYDTMVGLFDVNTENYNKKYDLTNKNYNLKPKDALVLHGRKKYINKNNYDYWQKLNAEYLISINQSSRIFPHRVNSIGKLKDIWNDGFRSLEVDILFGYKGRQIFQVGHDSGTVGETLETFLSSINQEEIERIWFDFKNLNINNYKAALKRLEYLNKKFNIKDKIILETGTKDFFFKEFKKNQWHTSYYLPTGDIVRLLKNKSVVKMEIIAKKIALQLKRQNLSAVSFDNRLYPFVKKYLEPKVGNSIVYHIWYGPSLTSTDFKAKLFKMEQYHDDRVKTILSHYKSNFEL